MSTVYSFQEQLVSIMDALSKTAVSEISKLVDIESKVLKLEITRGRNEIAVLSEKLQLMESLLWVDRGHIHDGKADTHSKTPTRAMNDSFGRPLSEPTRPGIKSERSCEHICSPQAMPGVHPVENGSPALETLPTTTSPGQSDLIVIKEEPAGMDIWNNGPKTDEKGVTTSHETEAGHLDVLQHCPDDSDNQPTLSESGVNHRTVPSCSGLMDAMDRRWNAPTYSQSQSAQQLRPAAQTNYVTGNSCGSTTHVSSQGSTVGRLNMKFQSLRTLGAKRFGCMQCGKSFRCYSQLEIHQRSHTGEKPYRCTLCGKRYAQKGHLYTHQRTHTGEKPYCCLECGKSFIQKCTLDMHKRTHTGEKPYVCMKCGKGFTKNCNLKKHMGVHADFSMHFNRDSRGSSYKSADVLH